MNCQYSEKILLYFYGEADEGLIKEIDAHLKNCVECRESLKVLGGVSQYLSSAKVEPDFSLTEGVVLEARRAEVSIKGQLRPSISGQEKTGGFDFGNILEDVFVHWKKVSSALVFAVLLVGVFFNFGIKQDNFKWTSDIDSGLDNLEYAMYEENDSGLGEYGESIEDFEYENIDDEIDSINETGRIL